MEGRAIIILVSLLLFGLIISTSCNDCTFGTSGDRHPNPSVLQNPGRSYEITMTQNVSWSGDMLNTFNVSVSLKYC